MTNKELLTEILEMIESIQPLRDFLSELDDGTDLERACLETDDTLDNVVKLLTDWSKRQ